MSSGLNKIYQFINKNGVFPGPNDLVSESNASSDDKVLAKYEYAFTDPQTNNPLKRKLSSNENEIQELWFVSKRRKIMDCVDEKESLMPLTSKLDLVSIQRKLSLEIHTFWLGSYGLNREPGMFGTFKLLKNGGYFEMDAKIKGQTCQVCFSLEALRSFFLSRSYKYFVFTMESKFASCICKQMNLGIDDLDYRKNSPLNCVIVRFTNKLTDEDVLFLEKMLITCQQNKLNSLDINVNWADDEARSLLLDIGIKLPPKKLNTKTKIISNKTIVKKSPTRKSMDIRPLLNALQNESGSLAVENENENRQPEPIPVLASVSTPAPAPAPQPIVQSAPGYVGRGRGIPNQRFKNNIQWESSPLTPPMSVTRASASVSRMSSLLLPMNRMPAPTNHLQNASLVIPTQTPQNLPQPTIIRASSPGSVICQPHRIGRLVPRLTADFASSKMPSLCNSPQPGGSTNSNLNHQLSNSNKSELKLSHTKGVNIPYYIINKLPVTAPTPPPSTNNSTSANSCNSNPISNGVITAMSNCSLIDSTKSTSTISVSTGDNRLSCAEFMLSDKKNQQTQPEQRVINNSNIIDVSSSPSLHALINSSPILQQNPNIVFTNPNGNNRFEMVPQSMTPRITEEVIEPFTYKPDDSRDGITLVNDDVMCLNEGNYINDSIINFYLKYVFHELLTPQQRERTHIFNCFFYNKLKDLPPNFPLLPGKSPEESEAIARHSSVRRWTRSVDIFEKDFIIIPINENSHWFLAIVCYAWMSGTISYTELFQSSNKVTPASCLDCIKPDYRQDPNTAATFQFKVSQMSRILKIRDEQKVEPFPCILLFDSLIGTPRSPNVRIIRDYLQVEWNTKRAERDGKLTFDKDTVRGFSPHVPQQPNFSDCGPYVLHYAENFFASPVLSYTKEYFQKNMNNWFLIDSVKGKRAEIQDLIIAKYKQQKKSDGSVNQKQSVVPSHLVPSNLLEEDSHDVQTVTVVREHIPEAKFVPKLEYPTHSQAMPVMVQQLVQSSAAPAIPIIIASSTGVVAQSSHINSSTNSLS